MPAPFSRLQLAAALIEYDNDAEDPAIPRRSAQESAIFAHLRRNPAARPDIRKSQLGTSQSGRDSLAETKRSRASRGSIDALRNPFAADEASEYDEEEERAEMEVDLSSWGLDAFIPKEKGDRSKKGKEKQGSVAVRSRKVSQGPHQEFGELGDAAAHSRAASAMNMRRQSTSSRLDMGEDGVGGSVRKSRAMSQSSMPMLGGDDGVPFPSPRAESPAYGGIDTAIEQQHYPPRSQSRASYSSRQVLGDPMDQRVRTTSQGTMPLEPSADDNPFALRPPTTYTSRFDPKAPVVHERTYSTASRGTQQLLGNDDDADAESLKSAGRDRPYSVVELLRPKVLVMPSPLQNTDMDDGNQPYVREGFQSSRDGPPLPPGARTTRRMSTSLDAVPNPTNSFIPNATADLSLAQRVFRDTLVTHGAGGYASANEPLPRAVADGEQVEFEPPPPEEEAIGFFGEGQGKPNRPAGKLFGKSLIDDLESRKAQMRNKQRVFYGDQRPTMMARSSNRSSTLIDPATLDERPGTQRQSSYGSQPERPGLTRRGSSGAKPFLSFDEESKHHQLGPGERVPKNKSVFGVDTLWEQEMAKLKIIQEQEKIEQEERARLEEQEAKRKAEKQRQKKKLKKKGAPVGPEDMEDDPPYEREAPRAPTPEAPPVLPDIQPATSRRAAPAEESDDDSSDSDEEQAAPPPRVVATAWHSDSEDEKKPAGPLRTTGVGLRNPGGMQQRQSDSEEDLPLATAKHRAVSRHTKSLANPLDSDDEDKPLSRVIQEKGRSPVLDIDFDRPAGANSDDDDSQPLAVRASTLMLNRNDDDDDKPLAFHPEQQRRTQYNMFAAQQQHQNQLMMQAQFHNSMFFNQPMMSPQYFGPPMAPMMNPMAMMQAPIPIPSPPPLQDQNKFLSVDKWRRDVVVDGEQH